MPIASLVTAISASAAAGKNPWLPLAVILLLAQADTAPPWLIDPTLHRGLHELGAPWVLLTLGVIFLVLSLADSFADKVGWIEAWLTPISTAWRPFAAIAVSALIGVSTLHGLDSAAPITASLTGFGAPVGTGAEADSLSMSPALWLTLCIGLGALAGMIATVGKTGTRLLLTMVPVPGVRVAHSFVDDLFAWGATLGGLVLGDSLLMAAVGLAYLGVGLFTAPLLARLSLIQLRMATALWRKHTSAELTQAAVPGWLRRALPERELSHRIPAYSYRLPGVGLCRSGYLIIDAAGVTFVARRWFRAVSYHVAPSELARLGLAETLSYRAVTLAARGGPERTIYLFPGVPAVTSQRVIQATQAAGLIRLRPGSPSAKLRSDAPQGSRYLPRARLGDLRLQGLLTLSAAIILGVLTGGVWVPIGAGYLASPFKGRFVIGLLISGYLAASVVFSVGFFWPVAILYAAVLNAITLRDLSRHALKAHLDGTVDTWSFLPTVPCAVWASVAQADDRQRPSDPDPISDGSWRVVWRLLRSQPA